MQRYVADLQTGDVLTEVDEYNEPVTVTIDNFVSINDDLVAVCGFDQDGNDYYREYDLDDIVSIAPRR